MHRLIRTLAFAMLVPLAAAAQQYPNKVVRLMVPFPPGGATDIIGRLVSAKMQDVWGQPVVVENKPGAGTVVGTDYVAKSAPDGHTLGMVVTAYVINPSLRADMPYNTLRDLAGVTQVSVVTFSIAQTPEAGRRADAGRVVTTIINTLVHGSVRAKRFLARGANRWPPGTFAGGRRSNRIRLTAGPAPWS